MLSGKENKVIEIDFIGNKNVNVFTGAGVSWSPTSSLHACK